MIWIFHFVVVHILLYISRKMKKDKIFIHGTFLYSIITFGQRWMTGEDFPGYLLYYIIDFPGEEIGYFGLQKIFSSLDLYFGLFIFLIYFITIYTNYKFIHRINKNTVLMIYLYMFIELYFAQMSQIRQFIAVGFFINSYFFMFDRKYLKTILCSLVAISFHFSALLMIPLLFVRLKLSKGILLFFLIICFALPLINIKPIFNLGLFEVYSHYIGGVYDTKLSIFHYIRYYVILLVFLLYIFNLKIKISTNVEKMILTGVVIYLLFYGLSFQFAPMLRISNYFKMFELVFICYYYKELKGFSPGLIKGIVVSIVLLLYMGVSVVDPYNISRYEMRLLQIHEDRSDAELLTEIEQFYYD